MIRRIIISIAIIMSFAAELFAEEPIAMRVNTSQGGFSDFSISEIESIEFISEDPLPVKTILYGKKIGYNGDSLFAGITANGGGPAEIISRLTRSFYENRAKGGATIAAAGDGGHCVVADIDNMAADLDLICFDGGVNDYWRGVAPGEITSPTDFTGTLDESSYIGALESVFRKALTRWPGKPIVFIIPHKISGAYSTYKGPYSYEEFTEGAKNVCRKYGIPFIDGEAVFNLNGTFTLHRKLYFINHDGVHPTEDAYRRYWIGPMISLFASLLL